MTKNMTTLDSRPEATAGRFWLPTIPFTLIDAVNRYAAATGSVRYAMLASSANYNGHMLSLTHTTRGYWTLTYFFGERVTLARGTVSDCLRAAADEYHKRAAKGTVVRTPDLTPEEAELAKALGFVPWNAEIEEAHNATWFSDLHGLVNEAFNDEKYFCSNAVGTLLQAKDANDYYVRRMLKFSERHLGNFQVFIATKPGDATVAMILVSKDSDKASCSLNGRPSLSGSKEAARKWCRDLIAKGLSTPWEVVQLDDAAVSKAVIEARSKALSK